MTTKPNRPEMTPELLLQVAQAFCTKNGMTEEEAEDIADCYDEFGDGYTLAKDLESRCCWNITSMDVDRLDGFSNAVSEALRKAEKAWAQEHDIQPPLPIGTAITQGVIAGIYTHGAASYLVKEKGCTQEKRFLIVKFEDAKQATGAAA